VTPTVLATIPESENSFRIATRSGTIIIMSDGTSSNISASGFRIGSAGEVITFHQVTPTGTINGSNTSFSLPDVPDTSQCLAVFLDGLEQYQTSDYSLTSSTITFVVAPAIGQVMRANYITKA
jgi:hypothetical protein